MNSTSTARDRILQAAFELISTKGYLGSSTREIALRANVAEVTLFRQFTSKESLFAEVLRSFSAIPALSELLPQLKSLQYREALAALSKKYLEQALANRSWIRVLSCEISHAPEEMKNVYGDFLKQLFGVLTAFFLNASEQGAIRTDLKPEHAARAFHSMFFGFFHIEGLCGIKADHVTEYHDMVDGFVEIFCRGSRTLD